FVKASAYVACSYTWKIVVCARSSRKLLHDVQSIVHIAGGDAVDHFCLAAAQCVIGKGSDDGAGVVLDLHQLVARIPEVLASAIAVQVSMGSVNQRWGACGSQAIRGVPCNVGQSIGKRGARQAAASGDPLASIVVSI